MTDQILIVDDESAIRFALRVLLELAHAALEERPLVARHELLQRAADQIGGGRCAEGPRRRGVRVPDRAAGLEQALTQEGLL